MRAAVAVGDDDFVKRAGREDGGRDVQVVPMSTARYLRRGERMEVSDPQGGRLAGPGIRPARKPRVLFVEDNFDTRDLYAWCMRVAGWDVDTVSDGLEAVPVAALFQPDLIVMDLHLIVVGGIEATRRLKADSRTAHIAVVACTAYGRQHEAELRQLGVRLVVPKPCDPDDLRVILEGLVAPSNS